MSYPYNRHLSLRHGGTWKYGTARVRHSGVWKTPQKTYVKHAGTWKQVHYTYGPVQPLPGGTFSDLALAPDDAQQYVSFWSDGGVHVNGGAFDEEAHKWFEGGTPDQTYQVRADYVSGDTVPAGTYATWLNLISVAHTWTLYLGTSQPDSASGTIQFSIRRQADAVVVATGLYTIAVYIDI